MLCSAADDNTKFTTLAPLFYDKGNLLFLVKEDGIRFRTIHDAQTATFVRDTRLINNFSNSVHSSRLPVLNYFHL
jgi:hypothetical protein